MVLADIAPRRPCDDVDAKAQAARNDDNLAGRRVERAQLRRERDCALLRHDQQLAVGIVEVASAHRPIASVLMDADARLRGDVAVARDREQPVDEIRGRLRQRKRIPAQLVRRRLDIGERRTAQLRVTQSLERAVHGRGTQAIEPGAPVLCARRGERGARQLLRVQTIRNALRRIAARGQCTGQRFGGELVAEAALIVERRARGRRFRLRGPRLALDRTIHDGHDPSLPPGRPKGGLLPLRGQRTK